MVSRIPFTYQLLLCCGSDFVSIDERVMLIKLYINYYVRPDKHSGFKVQPSYSVFYF